MSYQKFISEALRSYKSSQQEQNVDYTSPTQGLSSYIMPSNVYSRFEGMSPIQVGNMGGMSPPTSPYLSALSEYIQNMPTTNTWDWEGGEASPYGIRTPGLGWAWHYDETGNPVPNNPNTQIGLRGGRY